MLERRASADEFRAVANPAVNQGKGQIMKVALGVMAFAVMTSSSLVCQQREGNSEQEARVRRASAIHQRGLVCFDEVDGTLWARGDDFKASFSNDAVSFIPFLGSTAPRNFPVTMQVASVTAGERTVELSSSRGARRNGDRITIDRGSVIEAYVITATQIEQTFRFERSEGAGELIVRLAVQSELGVSVKQDGALEFANDLGGVRYGRALVVDAAGHKAAMETSWRGGAIELRVPEAFLSEAVFPVTIDPTLSTFVVPAGGSVLSVFHPDVAYDLASDRYAAVYEEAYSATDHDIFVATFDALAQTISTDYIDYTTSYWAAPKIANNRIAAQFLVVAEKTLSGGATVIFGRTVQPTIPLAMGAQFQISGAELGLKSHPDVGGDPSPYSPTYYCVCWQSTINSNKNVYYNLVQANNGLVLPTNPSPFLGFPTVNTNSKPSISKSDGNASSLNQNWQIVFQRTYSATDEDIWGALVHWDGAVVDNGFAIDTSGYYESDPAASSVTDELTLGGPRQWLAVYQKLDPGNPPFIAPQYDLYGTLFTGASYVTGANLTSLVGASAWHDQTHPCVDSDGTRFTIGFTDSGLVSDLGTPYLATVHVANGTSLGLTEGPVSVNAYPGLDDNMRITSKRSGGGVQYRSMAVHDVESTFNGTRSVLGALYDGWSPAAGGAYVNYVLPGCGGLTLSVTGFPALGLGMNATLSGVQGTGVIAVGTAISPVALCTGCLLGVDPATATLIQATSVSATVPLDGSLVNVAITIQGADIGSVSGCAGSPSFTLSDCVIVTIL